MSDGTGLALALAAVQADLPPIVKTERADVRTDKGNYSYTYADLAAVSRAIMPKLGEHGLAFIAKPTRSPVDGSFVLAYALLHESGDRESGEYPLPDKGTAQQIGSAITYARRYCLCAVTGVAPDDDDDGAAASAPVETVTYDRDRQPSQSRPRRRDDAAQPSQSQPTKLQRGRIFAELNGRGIRDENEQRALLTEFLDRPITSRGQLTYDDASRLIDWFERNPYTSAGDAEPAPGRPENDREPDSAPGPEAPADPTTHDQPERA